MKVKFGILLPYWILPIAKCFFGVKLCAYALVKRDRSKLVRKNVSI